MGCGETPCSEEWPQGSAPLSSSCSPSQGTFPVAATLILLFLIVVLTHSWASDLTLVPQGVAGEMVPPEVHSPRGHSHCQSTQHRDRDLGGGPYAEGSKEHPSFLVCLPLIVPFGDTPPSQSVWLQGPSANGPACFTDVLPFQMGATFSKVLSTPLGSQKEACTRVTYPAARLIQRWAPASPHARSSQADSRSRPSQPHSQGPGYLSLPPRHSRQPEPQREAYDWDPRMQEKKPNSH